MSDELTERVMQRFWLYLSQGPEPDEEDTYVDDHDFVTDIIALVRADERKRIREALLSDEAVEAGSDAMYITIQSEPGSRHLIYEEDVPHFETGYRAALAAIGLTEEGDTDAD